jgi:hypothetical protein
MPTAREVRRASRQASVEDLPADNNEIDLQIVPPNEEPGIDPRIVLREQRHWLNNVVECSGCNKFTNRPPGEGLWVRVYCVDCLHAREAAASGWDNAQTNEFESDRERDFTPPLDRNTYF